MLVESRHLAASFALAVLSACASNAANERGSFRYYALQSNAEYAERCAPHVSRELVLIAEEVSQENGLYNALLVVNSAPAGGNIVLIQRGCAVDPVRTEMSAAEILLLAAESQRLRGEYYVGRGVDDGVAYYVRAIAGAPSFSVYEPSRSNSYIAAEDLVLLRAWATLIRQSDR